MAEIEEAVKAAEASPAPEPPAAFQKVFARPLRPMPGVPAEYAASQDGIAPRRPDHGPSPADAPVRTLVDTVRETIREAMAADERVFVLGEDVGNRGGVFKATDGLITEFGEGRVLDMPLAESAIIGVAIGAALHGLRPIAEIQFADFIHPAFDQIVSEAARIHYRSNGDFSVPMVIRAPYGGGVHGALYHSQSVESIFAHVPGLKVVVPLHAVRPQGPAAGGHRRPRPGAVPGAQEGVPVDQGAGARGGGLAGADRCGRGRPDRHGRDHRHLRAPAPPGRGGGRARWPPRASARSRSSTSARSRPSTGRRSSPPPAGRAGCWS